MVGFWMEMSCESAGLRDRALARVGGKHSACFLCGGKNKPQHRKIMPLARPVLTARPLARVFPPVSPLPALTLVSLRLVERCQTVFVGVALRKVFFYGGIVSMFFRSVSAPPSATTRAPAPPLTLAFLSHMDAKH